MYRIIFLFVAIFLIGLTGCSKVKMLNWDKGGTASGSNADPTPTPPGGATDFGTGGVQAKPRLADKNVVARTLLNVFVSTYDRNKADILESDSITNLIRTNVIERPDLLGGPTDPMEEIWVIQSPVIKTSRGIIKCPKGLENLYLQGGKSAPAGPSLCNENKVVFPSIPSSSAVRQGHMYQTCESLVLSVTALTSAINKVQGSASYDSAHITKAYQLFYPTRTPSSEVVDSLNAAGLSNAQANPTGNQYTMAWQMIFLTLCSAPGWQIL